MLIEPGLCGVPGADFAGGAFCFSSTLPEEDELRTPRIANESEVNMKTAAAMVVALESTVADPRGPKAVCEPIPPKAPARSAALPLCSNTTTTRIRHTII